MLCKNTAAVFMLGGLHIEMAFLAGDWLESSGWVSALVQADVASPGVADSFFKNHMSSAPDRLLLLLIQVAIYSL